MARMHKNTKTQKKTETKLKKQVYNTYTYTHTWQFASQSHRRKRGFFTYIHTHTHSAELNDGSAVGSCAVVAANQLANRDIETFCRFMRVYVGMFYAWRRAYNRALSCRKYFKMLAKAERRGHTDAQSKRQPSVIAITSAKGAAICGKESAFRWRIKIITFKREFPKYSCRKFGSLNSGVCRNFCV